MMNPFFQFVKQLSDRLGSGLSSVNQQDPGEVAYLRNLEREMQTKDVLEIPLTELHVVVFDMETTGFYPYKGDRILSIGAVKVEGTEMIKDDLFYSLVRTETKPSDEISRLTGITEEMMEAAPPLAKALKEFFHYVKANILVAHHANHEKQFMEQATWMTLKKSFHHRIVDTNFLTRITKQEKKLFTLEECCGEYGIRNERRHHALSDAMAAAELWVACVKDLQRIGLSNLKDVYTYLATM